MIDQQTRMFRYVSGFSSLRSLFPMSTLSELMSGLERGVMTFEETVTKVSAHMIDHGLGTTLRVHRVQSICSILIIILLRVVHWKAHEARKRVVYEPRVLSSVVSTRG